jgi:hypothetical protein
MDAYRGKTLYSDFKKAGIAWLSPAKQIFIINEP